MAEKLVMASVEEARALMVRMAGLAPSQTVPMAECYERVLAEPIIAMRDQPPFDSSAMDGYAVREGDTPGVLSVIGESAAGNAYTRKVGRGQAVRIFTGAPVPDGADAIVIQEDAQRAGDQITTPGAAAGKHIRPRGGDFKVGDTLLSAGASLDGFAVTLAAASGHGEAMVRRWPRVCVLSTGDELVRPGGEAGPDQIYESVSYGLAPLMLAWGANALRLDPCSDDEDEIADVASGAFEECDLLVTIGGASVGDHDRVKPALAKLGLEVAIEKVNVRPGKPTWFGRVGEKLVLGLPGNPASALVCAHLFLRPILDGMLGRIRREALVRARLGSALPANGPREHYLRARLSVDDEARLTATPFEAQDSSLMRVFNDANALVRLKPDAPALETGALVDAMRLDRL